MKYITQGQFKELDLVNRGARPMNPILRAISKLGKGEGLVVESGEWTAKSSLSSGVAGRGVAEGKKFVSRRLQDGSGWAVLRTK